VTAAFGSLSSEVYLFYVLNTLFNYIVHLQDTAEISELSFDIVLQNWICYFSNSDLRLPPFQVHLSNFLKKTHFLGS